MDNWHNYSGSFVEQFKFSKADEDELNAILEPKGALHVINKLTCLIEIQKQQNNYSDNDTKEALVSKLNKIDTGLSKAIEVMGTLDRTVKDLLPQFMYHQELELTKLRNEEKLKPKFDPRSELLITLNAVKELKSNIGKPTNLPIFFALEILNMWEKHISKIDNESLQMPYWSGKTNDEEMFTQFASIALRNIRYVAEDLSYLYNRAFQEKSQKNS